MGENLTYAEIVARDKRDAKIFGWGFLAFVFAMFGLGAFGSWRDSVASRERRACYRAAEELLLSGAEQYRICDHARWKRAEQYEAEQAARAAHWRKKISDAKGANP